MSKSRKKTEKENEDRSNAEARSRWLASSPEKERKEHGGWRRQWEVEDTSEATGAQS